MNAWSFRASIDSNIGRPFLLASEVPTGVTSGCHLCFGVKMLAIFWFILMVAT